MRQNLQMVPIRNDQLLQINFTTYCTDCKCFVQPETLLQAPNKQRYRTDKIPAILDHTEIHTNETYLVFSIPQRHHRVAHMTSQQPIETPPRQWISNFHIVLPDMERKRILLLPSDTGWKLPSLAVEDRLWVGKSRQIITHMREKLGLTCDFTVLRYLHRETDEEDRWDQTYLVLELHANPTEPPLGGQWVDRVNLAEVAVPDEKVRGWLLDYLDEETAGEFPPLRAPWARAGWFSATSAWMTKTLTGLERPPTGAVQQFRNLGISSLLRVPTQAGLVYLKATAKLPLFVNEAVLMTRLAERFPGQIPPPLAIEPEKGWMLLDDFGTDLGTDNASAEEVAGALRQFGALQIKSAPALEELLGLGCFDRRLSVLTRQLDLLVDHPLSRCHVKPDDLTQLRSLVPDIKKRCTELASYHLPDTLVHGDLHMGNMARNGEGYLFYDWSDACIAHPFLDMIAPYFFYGDPKIQEQMREVYLSQWTAWEPVERLREAWRLAKPLAALHQAVSYLHILIGQEEVVHEEMTDGLCEFIALTLAAMAEKKADQPDQK